MTVRINFKNCTLTNIQEGIIDTTLSEDIVEIDYYNTKIDGKLVPNKLITIYPKEDNNDK